MKEDKISGPVHALADVVEAAQEGRQIVLRYGRARAFLERVYLTRKEVDAKARHALSSLTEGDYVESVRLSTTGEEADVYYIEMDEIGWYIKFYLSNAIKAPHEQFVVCLSFHPPEHPLTTKDGRKIKS